MDIAPISWIIFEKMLDVTALVKMPESESPRDNTAAMETLPYTMAWVTGFEGCPNKL